MRLAGERKRGLVGVATRGARSTWVGRAHRDNARRWCRCSPWDLADGGAGESLEGGAGDAQCAAEADDGEAFGTVGRAVDVSEVVRGGATDAKDASGLFDGQEVGKVV